MVPHVHGVVLGTQADMDVAELDGLLDEGAPALRDATLAPEFFVSAVLHVHRKHFIVILRPNRVEHNLDLLRAAGGHTVLNRVGDEDVGRVLPRELGGSVAGVGDNEHLLD